VLVFDATTIASLFDSYREPWTAWKRANEDRLKIGFPTTAMVEAAKIAGVRKSAWEAFLWAPGVEVLPLGATAAVEIGEWPGLTIASRHALWEAMQMNCPLMTRDAGLYAPGIVPIIVV
jgi:hypothetical protein